jgi:hypothetical protein
MNPDWFAGADIDIARSDSMSRGMNDQLWPIYDGYAIESDVIKPRGNARYYFPMSKPKLPYELAKIAPGDQQSALEFVRNWGLLGRVPLIRDSQYRTGGDSESVEYPDDETLQFIWGHALTVRNVLKLHKALQDGRSGVLDEVLADDIVVLGPSTDMATLRPESLTPADNPNDLKQWWRRMERHQAKISVEMNKLSSELLALKIISTSISKNLEGTNPVVDIKPSDNTDFHDSKLGRLQFSFRHKAPVQCAYWRLAMLVSTLGSVAQCRECGGFFERTDKRQNFCPPSDEQVNKSRYGTGGRAQSLCSLRNRARRHRESGG